MIVQVSGDPDRYSSVRYVLGDRFEEACYSSEALRRFLGDDVLLLVPESLAANIDDFREKVRKKGLNEFKLHVIPAVGEYLVDGSRKRFLTNFDDVAVAIFLHFLTEKPDRLIVDISTGHNVYTVAMVEAARGYATYRKLEDILQGSEGEPEFNVEIASSPPIMKDVSEVGIELHPLSVKAFFSLPVADPDKLLGKGAGNELKKVAGEIGKKYTDLKKGFRSLYDELQVAFNAVRYNVPLAFYTPEVLVLNLDADEVEVGMIEFVKELLKPLDENEVVKRIPLSFRAILNVFYAIALYRGFQKFMRSLSEPSIEEIRRVFLQLYKKESVGAAVNEYFLDNELRKIEELKEKISGKVRLLDLYSAGCTAEGVLSGSSDIKRNFFAHSGLLKECTEVELKNGKIYLSWTKDRVGEIKKWLKEP
ncbi:MAG: TM1812 family CRISPR-associated protein [Candidatus Jordarchaeales archaeon]